MPRNTDPNRARRITVDCPECNETLHVTVYGTEEDTRFFTPTHCPHTHVEFEPSVFQALHDDIYVAAVTPEYDEDEDRGFPARAVA